MTIAPSAPTGEVLDDRYGRTPRTRRGRRRGFIALLTVLILGAAAWAAWSGIGGTADDTLDLQTNSFHLDSDRTVTVGWTVGGETTVALVCTIAAQAEDHSVVGVTTTRVPALVGAGTTRSGTTTVRVTQAAVTGLISSCARA